MTVIVALFERRPCSADTERTDRGTAANLQTGERRRSDCLLTSCK